MTRLEAKKHRRNPPAKPVSEVLLEEYLARNGASFEYEPQIDGKRKRPDYRFRWGRHDLIVEVKEIH
ncbi:MAG: hypothetical protein V3T70_07690, partial [Phycisphaerae bacterium]